MHKNDQQNMRSDEFSKVNFRSRYPHLRQIPQFVGCFDFAVEENFPYLPDSSG